jgi:riboflavin synthase
MFTGLIEQHKRVLDNVPGAKGNRLILEKPDQTLYADGESIAVDGVCLTLLPGSHENLMFDVSPETLGLTTLGQLQRGDQVNLERAMSAHGRFGGHYVSGHVDTTACVQSRINVGEYVELKVGDFAMPAARYLLPKGSITLNGVSLTINSVQESVIQIMLVPHTLAVTNLGQVGVGQRLNVEFDYLTRIVAHQLTLSGQLKSEV